MSRLPLPMATHLVLFNVLCYGANLASYIAFLATARRSLGSWAP